MAKPVHGFPRSEREDPMIAPCPFPTLRRGHRGRRVFRKGEENLEVRPLGVATVAVNPNLHPDYPDESLEGMSRAISRWGIDFPYLADADQSLVRVLGAVCTPEFFLYDAQRTLVYHGRLDDHWQDESRVTRQELREAILALVEGRPIPEEQHPSKGCSIKWLETP